MSLFLYVGCLVRSYLGPLIWTGVFCGFCPCSLVHIPHSPPRILRFIRVFFFLLVELLLFYNFAVFVAFELADGSSFTFAKFTWLIFRLLFLVFFHFTAARASGGIVEQMLSAVPVCQVAGLRARIRAAALISAASFLALAALLILYRIFGGASPEHPAVFVFAVMSLRGGDLWEWEFDERFQMVRSHVSRLHSTVHLHQLSPNDPTFPPLSFFCGGCLSVCPGRGRRHISRRCCRCGIRCLLTVLRLGRRRSGPSFYPRLPAPPHPSRARDDHVPHHQGPSSQPQAHSQEPNARTIQWVSPPLTPPSPRPQPRAVTLEFGRTLSAGVLVRVTACSVHAQAPTGPRPLRSLSVPSNARTPGCLPL